ncbi:MAG: large conductance mechanosensitive channel protein MscL [Oscillospiraceae bacterium]|nr:MAG: large conductance mechanosensitive channel protein MscL [Oscillospiraceae bacterium]
MSKKKGGFWSDFKAFITRGNVVDMAVGVVIGGAFGKIVTGLVNYVINPCVSLLTDGTDLDNIKTVLRKGVEATEGVEAVPEVAILWGTWIQTILDFILVAFCIFPCTARDDARQEQAGCEEDRRGRSRQGCRASGS